MILHVLLQPADKQAGSSPSIRLFRFSQGRTEEEAFANIKEAATAWMWAENQKALKSVGTGQIQSLVAV